MRFSSVCPALGFFGKTGLLLAILLGPSHSAFARTTVEAYTGFPFGVARVTVDVPQGGPLMPAGDDRFNVAEANGRALYPALQNAPVRRVIRQLLEMDAPARVSMYFLFQGTEPLDLTVYAPTAMPLRVAPIDHPRKFARLLDAWWGEYTGHYGRLARDGEYPIVVQNYLTSTLARRLQLTPPSRPRGLFRSDGEDEALGLILGTESIRAAMQKDLLLENRNGAGTIADQPLPAALVPPAVEFPPSPAEVAIEPIAMHVPQECFYVRFGTFLNCMWLRDFNEAWGGDLANMINVRGIDYQTGTRFERQLGLKYNSLAKILGPRVVADIAIFGSDTFVREGVAIGVLIHAKNNLLLRTDLGRQRGNEKAKHDDATEETITIAGHKVSLISTPGGQMRSYYASDGDFHCVTTSRTIMRRFFEAGEGTGALGRSDEFRHARIVRPLENDDTVFAYLSDAFIRQMVSPHYRVEMTRRMRSLAEMDALRIARLAARAEGVAAHTVDELIAADLLPTGFGKRPDESRLIETDRGMVDSLRGMPGTFVPIPDMPVTAVTASEAAAYRRFGEVYLSEWHRIDPIIAAVRRTPLGPPGLERLTVELMITPYHKGTYGFADWLGPPTTLAKAPVAGDVASLEVVFSGRLLATLAGGPAQPTRIFGALRDFRFPFTVQRGRVDYADSPQNVVRGYLGVYPLPNLLDRFAGGPDQVAFDEDGYAPPADGVWLDDCWQRRFDDWGVLSFKRDVLEEVTPQLAMVEMERPAQVRLRVEDLSDKALSEAVNALGYQQARKASASGSRFMNSLARQLRVPPPECKTTAEAIVGGTFQCPLRGEYTLVEPRGGEPVWVSDALSPSNQFLFAEVPPDYIFPLLIWFRGITAELSLTGDTLWAYAQLDIQNKTGSSEKPTLPEFRLPDFGFGRGKQPAAEKTDEPTPLEPPDPEELPPPK